MDRFDLLAADLNDHGDTASIAAALRSVDKEARQFFDPEVDEAKTPDGGLDSLGWYLSFEPGDETATLDGRFSANHLRAIATHMEARSIPAPAKEKCGECRGAGEIRVSCRNGDACSMKKEPHFMRCPKCAEDKR